MGNKNIKNNKSNINKDNLINNTQINTNPNKAMCQEERVNYTLRIQGGQAV